MRQRLPEYKVTPLAWILLVVFVAGVVLLIAGSTGLGLAGIGLCVLVALIAAGESVIGGWAGSRSHDPDFLERQRRQFRPRDRR